MSWLNPWTKVIPAVIGGDDFFVTAKLFVSVSDEPQEKEPKRNGHDFSHFALNSTMIHPRF